MRRRRNNHEFFTGFHKNIELERFLRWDYVESCTLKLCKFDKIIPSHFNKT